MRLDAEDNQRRGMMMMGPGGLHGNMPGGPPDHRMMGVPDLRDLRGMIDPRTATSEDFALERERHRVMYVSRNPCTSVMYVSRNPCTSVMYVSRNPCTSVMCMYLDGASFPSVAGMETAQRKTLAHTNLT